MEKNYDFKVYLIDDELYVLEYDQAHLEKPKELKLTPLYNFIKNDKLVKNKTNLKERVIDTSGADIDWKNPLSKFYDSPFIGTLFHHEDNSENSFSFNIDAKNPFLTHVQIPNTFFVIQHRGYPDVTFVPFQSVMWYRLSYTEGQISDVQLVLNNNSMVTINNQTHDYFLTAIDAFNRWSEKKALNEITV